MLQEKDMVNDALAGIKSSLAEYAKIIGETDDQQLRQQLIQIRNSDETFQYDLYKLAEQKGYYQPSMKAQQNEVQQVKTQLSQGQNQTGIPSMMQ